ncbi:MAG: hypothetical protein V1663_00035 [archaeon]
MNNINNMNKLKKGEMTIWSVVRIILVLIIVFIILNFLGINLWTLGKSALGFTSNVELINYTQKNQQGVNAFSDLVKGFNDCKNSNNKDCGCNVYLEDFYNTHALLFNSKETQLINVKELKDEDVTKGVTMERNDVVINCLFKNNNFETETRDMVIDFRKNKPYIQDKNLLGMNTKNEFVHNFVLYKNNKNEICWLTDEVSSNAVKNKNSC